MDAEDIFKLFNKLNDIEQKLDELLERGEAIENIEYSALPNSTTHYTDSVSGKKSL